MATLPPTLLLRIRSCDPWKLRLLHCLRQNPSQRRSLGHAASIRPEWSPDSRYLLLWKYSLFRCGFFIDVDGPATLEFLDIETGNRLEIRSSRCQLELGSAGWLNSEIREVN